MNGKILFKKINILQIKLLHNIGTRRREVPGIKEIRKKGWDCVGDITLNCCDTAYIILENEMRMQIAVGEDEEVEIETGSFYNIDGVIYEVVEIGYDDNDDILIDTIVVEIQKLKVK